MNGDDTGAGVADGEVAEGIVVEVAGGDGDVVGAAPGAGAKPPEPLPKNTCTLSLKPVWEAATSSKPSLLK